MASSPLSPPEWGGAEFLSTHWTTVLTAGQEQLPAAREALERLCGTYWYPLYAYVRRQGHDAADAQDLTQDFFARFLERKYVQLADPERGRFRTFLLTSLKHFLVNEWNKTNRLPALLVTAFLSVGGGSSARAEQGRNQNPQIFPPQSHPYGKTYSEWGAAWWQWTFSIPAEQNPVSDSTGEFSGVGQDGPVFFLAGNFGGTTVRECTVPAGKALLIPLLNVPWVQFPTDPPYSIPELRDILAPMMDNATLACEIDGKSVRNPLDYREQSSVFSVTVPDGNLLGLDPGTYAPCVDDGYYLMLSPLKAGRHLTRLPLFGMESINFRWGEKS